MLESVSPPTGVCGGLRPPAPCSSIHKMAVSTQQEDLLGSPEQPGTTTQAGKCGWGCIYRWCKQKLFRAQISKSPLFLPWLSQLGNLFCLEPQVIKNQKLC